MRKISSTRLCGGSLLVLGAMLASNPAMAQANEDAVPRGEIVVTGLKRATSLLETPVAVTVYDEVKIQNAGITQPADFLAQTSNVSITTSINPGDFMINMRGQSAVRGAEPTVAIVIDGAYAGTPAEFNTALFDLEQIEVLKGPQGAYYGRNASAGAISITTKKPTEEFTGSAFISYGRNASYNTQASLSGAIIPNALSARLSMSVKGSDGSYTNVNTGEKSQRYKEESARLRLLFDNGGPLTVDGRITGVRGEGGSHYYTAKIKGVAGVSGLPADGTVVHGILVNDISANDNLNIPFVTDVPGKYRRDIVSGSVKIDYDLGFAEITSVTGLSWAHERLSGKNYPYFDYADGTTDYGGWGAIFGDKIQANEIENTQFQQEIRLTSSGKNFIDYQVGFQYIHYKKDYTLFNTLNGRAPDELVNAEGGLLGYNGYTDGVRTLIGGGAPLPYPFGIYPTNSPYATTNFQKDRFTASNYAPFANVRVNFTDLLALSLAARYDIEKRGIGAIGPSTINPFSGASFNPCVAITDRTAAECITGLSKTFKQLQPKATLNYTIDKVGSVYASWGRSFKSGGFNPIGTREQTVQGFAAQYEAALDLTPEAARAKAEQDVITQDFYNKEVSTTYEVGFKANLLDRRLYISGAAFWTDISNGQLYVFDPIVYVQSIQSIDKERVKGFEIDANFNLTDTISVFGSYGYIDAKIRKLAANTNAEGNRPPYVAGDTLSFGAQIDQPISDGKSIVGRVEYNRTGSTYYSIDNDPNYRRDPYDVVNARIGLHTEKWEFNVYGRNIFNTRYVNEIAPITSGISTAVSLAELATWGAEFRVRF